FFVLGLILMPLGVYLAARRLGGYRHLVAQLRPAGPQLARLGWAIAFATLANAGILTAAAYHGVAVMDSKEFCGQTCHSVMQPQYVRYQHSRHAAIPCVDCHIGGGAAAFFHYKLSGVRQLVRLTTKTYQRPIPPAMDRVRPASEICEACHVAGGQQQDRLKIIRHYDDDEQSTEKTTVLMVKVATKIHKAHIGRNIEYSGAMPDPQTIPTVTADGKTFSVEGAAPAAVLRRMDCMDCHNRSGHNFETPEAAVDDAIATGKLDRSRPFTRRDAVAALKGKLPIAQQPAVVQQIFADNVFSGMNITWGTYPNNIGHDASPGCFRCHDDQHKTKTGASITMECTACHEPVAVEEKNPEILAKLGIQ
ncbi:MAG TPA: NapC/NirT family cytochrome c, partial [Terriglobia bacterium]|nr:NapC/NirT family cytochrome c [Terriglobia bacterium]